MSAGDVLRQAKADMEQSILMATAEAVAAFKASTGATPSSIEIEFVTRKPFGAPAERMVNCVVARVEL